MTASLPCLPVYAGPSRLEEPVNFKLVPHAFRDNYKRCTAPNCLAAVAEQSSGGRSNSREQWSRGSAVNNSHLGQKHLRPWLNLPRIHLRESPSIDSPCQSLI